jgi:hypothetical protein
VGGNHRREIDIYVKLVLVKEALMLLKIRCLVVEICVHEKLWFSWANGLFKFFHYMVWGKNQN